MIGDAVAVPVGRTVPRGWQTADGTDLSGAVDEIAAALAELSGAARCEAWIEDLDGLPVAGRPGRDVALRLPLHLGGSPVGTVVVGRIDGPTLPAIGALLQRHLEKTLELTTTIGEFVETTAWQWKEINFLLDVSQSLDPTSTAPQLCTTVLQRVVRVLGATGGTVRLVDAAGRLETTASDGVADRGPRSEACDAIATWVFENETPVLIDTAKDLPRGVMRREEITTALGDTAVLAAPLPRAALSGRKGTLGVLSVMRERGRTRFTAEDLKLLQTAATQMSVAIHHTQLLAQAKEAERLRREVEMAAEIQARLLPQTLPTVSGLEVRGWYRPATVVGGDYYDLIPLGPSDLYFVIADISGHGIASALFMSNARSVIRALLAGPADLDAVAETLNQRIIEDSGDSGMFLTAILGRYDAAAHRLALVNCGHPYPVLVRASGDIVTPETGSPPVGMLPVLSPEGISLDVAPGDLLFLYTDGLVEARGAGEEMFGGERAIAIVRDGRHEPLDVIGGRLLDALQTFRGRPELEDDLTMLIIRRVPSGRRGEDVDG
jgi:serine phosphatase RsbU (regulator of sigma subunit)